MNFLNVKDVLDWLIKVLGKRAVIFLAVGAILIYAGRYWAKAETKVGEIDKVNQSVAALELRLNESNQERDAKDRALEKQLTDTATEFNKSVTDIKISMSKLEGYLNGRRNSEGRAGSRRDP